METEYVPLVKSECGLFRFTHSKSWRIVSLAFAGLQIYRNPASITDPATVAVITTGVGLIAAKDGNKSGTATGM